MKTRNGFVSNSSSSSFIIIGVPLTDTIMEKLKSLCPQLPDEEDWDWYERIHKEIGIGVLYTEFPFSYLVGNIISDISNGDPTPTINLSGAELQKIINNIREKFGVEPNLTIGERPC